MRQARERQPEFKERVAKVSPKQALKYLYKFLLIDFIKLQFPKATEVPDSDMYFAFYPPKQNGASAAWTMLSKRERPDRERVRKPVIFMGRRLAIFGTVFIFIAVVLGSSLLRTAFS